MSTLQFYDDGDEVCAFYDFAEEQYTTPCQPRDIQIISGENTAILRRAIACDIRLNMGHKMTNLKDSF